MLSSGVFAALWSEVAASAASLQREFLHTPEGERLSYADVPAHSARLAHTLVTLGVQPGDRVAAQLDKTPQALMLYLATLRAGAVYLPLNSAYTEPELEYFLSDAQPQLFVCSPSQRDQLVALAARVRVPQLASLGNGPLAPEVRAGTHEGSLEPLARAQPAHFSDVPRTAADLAAILYTSGTTGRSKGAMLTHGNLLSNARTLASYWHFSAQDRLLHALPIFHIHGLFVAVNVVLASGASMIFLPRFDTQQLLQHLPDATVMMGVPTFYVRLLRERALTRELSAGVRLFISGSAPLTVQTHGDWRERTGHAILERYGMSETGMICSNPYAGERVPGSVGPALPGVSVRISDPLSGTPLPAGTIGMIEVSGPNVFAGYWRQPERTATDFRADGYFITGDLGSIDERGYVAIVGRGKDLIISGGYNVYPREVELQLDALTGVSESAVIGLPHPDYGEAVTAVVAVEHAAAISEAQILAALRTQLAAYKLPKRVLFVERLPRNVMGKLQMAELRATYAGLYGL